MLEARDHGELLQRRSRLPAALALSLVRAAARAGAGAAAATRSRATRPTRSSSSASPKCSTNTFTTIPPARRRGRRCSIERRRAGRTPRASPSERATRTGRRAGRDVRNRSRASASFNRSSQMKPAAPHDGLARAHLLLGAAYDRLGSRAMAVAAYNQAIKTSRRRRRERHPRPRPRGARSSPRRDSHRRVPAVDRRTARARTRRQRSRGLAAGARRRVDARRSGRRLSLLERAAGERRCDAVRDRRVERVIEARPAAPAIVLASACVDAAAISERDGERQRAIERYQRALDIVGGAPARARKRTPRTQTARSLKFFDNLVAFVLDIGSLGTIIYIWYEGGELRPPLVRLKSSTSPFRAQLSWVIASAEKA